MPNVVNWGRSAAYANVTRVQNTAANRQLLQQAAAQDGTPSAIVSFGQDIALISGDALRTTSRLQASRTDTMAAGQIVGVNGQGAQVLYTDDGLSEIDASSVIVAVVDTGVDVTHPALRGKLVQGYNSATGTTDVSDRDGHGTHVAGTIAGTEGLNPNAEGVAQGARIMPIKVADNSGRMTDQTISDGIIYAVQHGARVINLSLEDQAELPRTALAIDYAQKMGAVVVVAAGNEGRDSVDAPAKYDGAIAVGSSENGQRDTYSNGGARLDFTAPGNNITAPVPGGRYESKTGTSMAAPYVAGAAALILARHPEWTPAQVKAQLANTALDYGTRGKDNSFGYGEVNLQNAVFGGPAPSVRRVRQAPPSTTQRVVGWFQNIVGY